MPLSYLFSLKIVAKMVTEKSKVPGAPFRSGKHKHSLEKFSRLDQSPWQTTGERARRAEMLQRSARSSVS